MKAADLGNGDHAAEFWRLYGPGLGGVLLQEEMRA